MGRSHRRTETIEVATSPTVGLRRNPCSTSKEVDLHSVEVLNKTWSPSTGWIPVRKKNLSRTWVTTQLRPHVSGQEYGVTPVKNSQLDSGDDAKEEGGLGQGKC